VRILCSGTLLAVPRWLNYCCIMQILPLLCQQGSLLLNVHSNTVQISCNSWQSVKITRALSTATSCIDLSVRIVTKSPKVGPPLIFSISLSSVADPDPPDPHVLGLPGSGSIDQRYGSGSGFGSGSGSFYHHAKVVRKPLIPTIL
jgi:hypothetical protein